MTSNAVPVSSARGPRGISHAVVLVEHPSPDHRDHVIDREAVDWSHADGHGSLRPIGEARTASGMPNASTRGSETWVTSSQRRLTSRVIALVRDGERRPCSWKK